MRQMKVPATFDEQIDILRERGLFIGNMDKAREILSCVNYYRLVNAYSLGLYDCNPGVTQKSKYKDGVSLSQLYDIYQFDTILRHILFELIEHFELEFRTRVAYCLGHRYCATAYLRKEIYQNEEHFDSFIADFEREKTVQKKSLIVQHHNDNYDGFMPVWAMVEIVTFGTLSKLYKNLNKETQGEISRQYGVDPIYLSSWLNTFVLVRNACAHYGRLYNWRLPSCPKLFNDCRGFSNTRIFSVIYLLFKNTDNPVLAHSAYQRLRAAVALHPSANLFLVGFPNNWEQLLREKIGLEPFENDPIRIS